MCKLLMSIHPQHVDNILAGTKRFEFRKTKCREDIDRIIIYATAPVMQIVAEVEVTEIIEDSPQQVWEHTEQSAGIDKKYFDAYYQGRTTAVAYALGRVKRYRKPHKLSEFGIKAAPQSFVYVRND